MQSFSISGASEVLERDRRPIIRALRHAAPDEVVKKQQRSRMPTILAALEAREPKRNKQQHLAGNDSGRYGAFDNLDDDLANDRDTLRMFGPINAAIAKLEAQPSVAKRRDMAPALMLIVERSNKAYRSHRATTGDLSTAALGPTA